MREATSCARSGVASEVVFDKHCQSLVVVARGHESDRDRASGANARQTFQSRLEFLGGVVGAAHDDDVLLPSAYIELAIVDEPAVTGVQPAVLQHLIGEVGAPEVAGHDAGARDEDVADMVWRLRGPMVVAYLDPHARQGRAGADNLFAARLDDAFEGQSVAVDTEGFEGGARRFECSRPTTPPPCHSTG